MKRTEIIEQLSTMCGAFAVKAEAKALIEKDGERIEMLRRNLKDARNELCIKCGKYPTAYQGSCDGCRWAEDESWMI